MDRVCKSDTRLTQWLQSEHQTDSLTWYARVYARATLSSTRQRGVVVESLLGGAGLARVFVVVGAAAVEFTTELANGVSQSRHMVAAPGLS